jgi:hypothetical protein
VFWARYSKFWPKIKANWINVHIGLQSTGVVLVIAFVAYILAHVPHPLNFPNRLKTWSIKYVNPYICMISFSGMFLQVIMGVIDYLALRDLENTSKRYFKTLHHYFGRGLLLFTFFQSATGINTIFPWIDAASTGRGYVFWMVYFIVMCFWVTAFVGAEIYYFYFLNRTKAQKPFSPPALTPSHTVPPNKKEVENALFASSNMDKKKGVPIIKQASDETITTASPTPPMPVSVHTNASGNGNGMGIPGQGIVLETYCIAPPRTQDIERQKVDELALGVSEAKALRKFTWEDIDQELRLDNFLVVANGRYVYDINQWMNAHPGGRAVLHMAAGTDITNDFFAEVSYSKM